MYYLIVHDDLDGIASAALYCRLKKIPLNEVVLEFSSPATLPNTLSSLLKRRIGNEDVIVIADLGCNATTFNELVKLISILKNKGVKIEWYDHHIWDDMWVKSFLDLDVNLVVDTSTCTAELIVKSLGYEPDELSKATCAADLWKWDHNLAPYLYRLAYICEKRGLLHELFKRFYEGNILDDECLKLIEDYVSKEIENYNKVLEYTKVSNVNGCRIAVTIKDEEPPSRSHVAHYIMARKNVDVVVVYEIGHGLSFRSMNVDVRSFARALGGGGHLRAAGAKLHIPLHVRILSLFSRKILLAYIEKIVRETISRIGCNRI